MLFTLQEFIDLIIMTLVIGFIFSGLFYKPKEDYDPLKHSQGFSFGFFHFNFDFDDFKFAALITAPAIILHEMAHKLAAMYFGLQATFHAAYLWLGIGVILKLLSFPFIFFIPGYVSYTSSTLPLNQALIAFVGPGTNLVLWLGSWFLSTRVKKESHRMAFMLSSKINMFLFIFNMIPIPFFDGGHFFFNMLKVFGIG